MKNQYIARKWCNLYEIVYLDFANNNLHSHFDMAFTTLEAANKAAKVLNESVAADGKKWPIESAIPVEYQPIVL